jgi:hypothetical protein
MNEIQRKEKPPSPRGGKAVQKLRDRYGEPLVRAAFVFACAQSLHKLHGKTANRRQQQGVNKPALVQQKLFDEPNQKEEGTDVPEH